MCADQESDQVIAGLKRKPSKHGGTEEAEESRKSCQNMINTDHTDREKETKAFTGINADDADQWQIG